MPTERKVAQVEELRTLLDGALATIATSYQGMSVGQQAEMRRVMADAGLHTRVVKNTLLRIAARDINQEAYLDLLEGPTAIVIGREDIVATAKAVVDFKRAHPDWRFDFRRAVIDGRVMEPDGVRDLSTVPPREELIARIAGGLVGKLIELQGLLQATTREFAGLVEARAAQLESEGA